MSQIKFFPQIHTDLHRLYAFLWRYFPKFVIFFFFLMPFFSERYQISQVEYSLEKTREQDVRCVVPVNTEKIFESKEDLDSYLADLKQRLMNTRAFQDVKIENEKLKTENTKGEVSPSLQPPTAFSATLSAGTPRNPQNETTDDTDYTDEGSGIRNQKSKNSHSELVSESGKITQISLHITAQDTKHLLILPYPKYDSNDGLIFKVKVKDVNFLGTLNTMNVGAFVGLKEDVETGKQNLTFGAEFDYRYPFVLGDFLGSWNNTFDLQYTHGVNELEFWTGTGFTFEKPFKRVSLVLDVSEEFNRDLEYEDYGDTQHFTSDVNFSVPVKVFDIENWGYVFWTPFIDGKVSYDKDGISHQNDDLASPVFSAGQSVSTNRINWHGNFRTGVSAKIGHSVGYDFMQDEVEPRVFSEIQAFKGFKFIGFNMRFSGFVTKSNRGEVGSLVRGVRDEQKYLNASVPPLKTKKALKSPAALVLNVDIPIHLITTHWLDWSNSLFGEESWFSRTFAWTDKFNFELQMSPFIDIALTKNEITGRLFSPKDGWYTGGVEFLCFPERWKGIVMRASLGIDLGRMLISKKYPEKIDMSWRENVKKYEIYAGIGLHY